MVYHYMIENEKINMFSVVLLLFSPIPFMCQQMYISTALFEIKKSVFTEYLCIQNMIIIMFSYTYSVLIYINNEG